MKQTQEKQYQFLLDRPMARFGLMSSQVWQDDPRRLTFLLARYKFVSKMFSGMKNTISPCRVCGGNTSLLFRKTLLSKYEVGFHA